MRIAFLEDDPDQAELMMAWMSGAGFQPRHFAQGGKFISRVSRDSFDCIVLDWEVPDVSGMEVMKWIRNHYDKRLPVLFVTQREDEQDIVQALEAGADDYLVKPIRKAEFIARIRALVRRSGRIADAGNVPREIQPYEIDTQNQQISLHGEPVRLTHREYELAVFLFMNIGRVVSRDHILESVWGQYSDLNTRTVDTHISRIRTKLGLNEKQGWRLASIYMHGYRLDQLS